MDARDLALRAMQEQQAKGAEYIQNRAKELEDAKVNNVVAAPVSGSEEDTQAKDIQDGANLLLGSRK